MNNFEEWCINIITLLIMLGVLAFIGWFVGFGLYSIWQVIN